MLKMPGYTVKNKLNIEDTIMLYKFDFLMNLNIHNIKIKKIKRNKVNNKAPKP